MLVRFSRTEGYCSSSLTTNHDNENEDKKRKVKRVFNCLFRRFVQIYKISLDKELI